MQIKRFGLGLGGGGKVGRVSERKLKALVGAGGSGE